MLGIHKLLYKEQQEKEVELFLFDNRTKIVIGELRFMKCIGFDFFPNKSRERQGLHLIPDVEKQILYYIDVFNKKYGVEEAE